MRFGVREFIFLVVLLAVPAVSLLYVFKPRNADIQEALAEIDKKQRSLEKLASISDHIDGLSVAIDEALEVIRAIEEKLPSQEGVDTILQRVWEIAGEQGLLVKRFQPETTIPAAKYQEQPLTITMTGEFAGFYRFMQNLEDLQRITRVHDLRLKRTNSSLTSTANATIEATFALSIYYVADTDSLAAASN